MSVIYTAKPLDPALDYTARPYTQAGAQERGTTNSNEDPANFSVQPKEG